MLLPYYKPKASHIDLLSPNDMAASRFTLSLTMNQDENFDNRSAYGRWTKMQADPAHVRFQVEFGSEQSLPVLKNDDMARYLRETSYYDFNSPEVKALIAKVVEKHPRTAQEKVYEILDVVGAALQYDHEMLDRNEIRPVKASVSARAGKGVCQHYAALFVAIARAMGLPSRSVEGLAYINTTASSEFPYIAYQAVSHAWVEVSLDGQTWTPLDPQYKGRLTLPHKGYIPIKEIALYENSLKGADIHLRDTREMQDYEIDLTPVHEN
jgi:transglutaminase-like putative cysteine protease